MNRHHPKNERVKRRYLAYLEEAKRLSPKSADQAAAAIAGFEASTGYKDFARFHIEQARKFKRDLAIAPNPKGKPLAKATVHSRLMALKAFFQWLAGQPGYKSRISYSDAEYFNPSANDSRIATARREQPVPSLEQIRHVIGSMKTGTLIERRDQAIIAFALLTGVRDDAMASLSIRHVDVERRLVFQDARAVRTKNRKTFTSVFFPVGFDFEAIVEDWIESLRKDLLFGQDDPLFPRTKIGLDAEGLFAARGLERCHWTRADAIRRVFRQAFEAAGLPYFNPHSFRKTLALLGERVCKTPEAFKAWSQNMGHEQVLTTFTNYGSIPSYRQAEIFQTLRNETASEPMPAGAPDAQTIQRVLEHLRQRAGLTTPADPSAGTTKQRRSGAGTR